VVIREELQGLYNSYKSLNRSEHFVPCGVVNEGAYEASCPKLVCVLRKPNDPDQHLGWRIDTFLEKQVKKGSSGQSIYRMWQACYFESLSR